MLILMEFPLFGVIWGLWGPDAGNIANTNTFSMVLEAIFHFWTKLFSFGIDFYKVFRMRFPHVRKVVFPLVLEGISTLGKRHAKTFSW